MRNRIFTPLFLSEHKLEQGQTYLWVCSLLLILAVSAIAGFYNLFSTFRPYDDEGYWMMAIRLLLEGGILYDDVYIPYGPVSLVFKEILHGVMDVSITNTNFRWVTLAIWCLLSFTASILIKRISSSKILSLIAYITTFLYMGAFVNEPGHPQELIALFVVFLALIQTFRGAARWWLTGLILGLIFLTKMNAGVFYIAAVVSVLIIGQEKKHYWAWLRLGTLMLAIACPFVLISSHLGDIHGLYLAILCAISFSSFYLVLWRISEISISASELSFMLLGFMICLLFFWLYLLQMGSSAVSMFEAVIYFATEVKGGALLREYTGLHVLLAMISLCLALVCTSGRFKEFSYYCCQSCRLVVVLVMIYSLITKDPSKYHYLIAFAPSFVWVVLVGGEKSQFSARAITAALALWGVLITYPVPGSQLFFGSFMLVLVALICAWDMFKEYEKKFNSSIKLSIIFASFILIVEVGLLVQHVNQSRQYYRSLTALALPGTEHVRLPQHRVEGYRHLVGLFVQADVGFISSGLNSYYFWSGVNMAAPVIAQMNLNFLRREDRLTLIDGLKLAKRPLVLLKNPSYGSQKVNDVELVRWVKNNLKLSREYRGFSVMVRE